MRVLAEWFCETGRFFIRRFEANGVRSAYCVKNFTTHYALRITLPALFIFCAVIWGISLTHPSSLHAAPPAQAPDTKPSVSGGRALWTENCAPCHGPAGQGDGPTAQSLPDPPANFADPETARQLVPANIFEVIKNGRIEKLMPPWGNRFDDAQIWNLTAHVWRLSVTSDDLAVGEAIYTERCAACHAADGSGDTPDAPANLIDFTDLPTMVQRSQANLQAGYAASSQHDDLTALSDEELWQSLDYIRTFSFAVPQRNGILSGQVINATTNQPQGSVPLTLHVFEGQAEVETLTTQADDQGNFSFEKLLTDHSLFYVVEGAYDGVAYTSEPGVFVPNNPQTTLNLDVYGTTQSDEAIELNRINYLVSFRPNIVDVVQLFIVANNSNQTYVGQNGQTFTFSLPAEAANVSFQNDSGNRFTKTENNYTDSEPILPGSEGLVIAAIYEIPFQGDSAAVDIPIPGDTTGMNLLLRSQDGVQINSNTLDFIETRQLEGQEFLFYGQENLRQGDIVTLELTGLDTLEFAAADTILPNSVAATAAPVVNQGMLRWLVLGVGAVVLVLAGFAYPYFRPQLAPQTDEPDSTMRRQKLLLLLARLDDAFESGQLDEQVYRQARARYKAQLVELME